MNVYRHHQFMFFITFAHAHEIHACHVYEMMTYMSSCYMYMYVGVCHLITVA